MSKKLVVPVQVTKVQTKADFSMGVSLETPELSAQEVGSLIGFIKAEKLWAVFVDHNPSIKEIDETPAPDFPDFEKKSSSQRLREVLYRLWETTDRTLSSEAFYKRRMQKYFDEIQAELNNTID